MCTDFRSTAPQFDLAGFTSMAATMEPTVLAADMHALFSAFDK